MSECSNEMQLDHEGRISTVETTLEQHNKVFEIIKGLHDVLIQIATDNGRTTVALENQIKVQDEMVKEMREMKNIMVDKESIKKVHTKIEELEDEVDTLKDKPAQDALEQVKSVKKTMLIVGVAMVAGLIFLGLSVIWYMMKSGQVPTP